MSWGEEYGVNCCAVRVDFLQDPRFDDVPTVAWQLVQGVELSQLRDCLRAIAANPDGAVAPCQRGQARIVAPLPRPEQKGGNEVMVLVPPAHDARETAAAATLGARLSGSALKGFQPLEHSGGRGVGDQPVRQPVVAQRANELINSACGLSMRRVNFSTSAGSYMPCLLCAY